MADHTGAVIRENTNKISKSRKETHSAGQLFIENELWLSGTEDLMFIMQGLLRQPRSTVLPREETEMTDGELLESFINNRDDAAFEALLRMHGPMVLGVCQRVLGNHHDAEEAFQAAFIVLSRKAASIWPRNRVGNWLYGVAYRTALKAKSVRARRRIKESQNMNAPEPAVNPPAPWADIIPLLDRELNALPEKYRLPIVLCDIAGRSQKDVALELGCPEGTISGRLMRARALLLKRLTRHGVVLSAGALAVMITQNAASAAVPEALVATTASMASILSAGSVIPASVVSSKAAVLAKGVTLAMFIAKVKIMAVILVVVMATGLGMHTLVGEQVQPVAEKPLNPDELTDETAVIQEIKRLGGTVRKNTNAPNQPVVAVLFQGSKQVRDEDLPLLKRLKKLELLQLASTNITDAGIQHIAEIEHLTGLGLHHTSVTDTAMEALAKHQNLSVLNLGETQITNAGLKSLCQIPKLTNLGLPSNITDDGLHQLVRLKKLTNLSLFGPQITDAGMRDVGQLTSLKNLTLMSTGITDKGVRELRELKNLTDLFISDAKITDDSLPEIAKLPKLTTLSLNSCEQVTDKGLRFLDALSQLQTLDLMSTRATIDGVNQLRKSLPNVSVNTDESATSIANAPHQTTLVNPTSAPQNNGLQSPLMWFLLANAVILLAIGTFFLVKKRGQS